MCYVKNKEFVNPGGKSMLKLQTIFKTFSFCNSLTQFCQNQLKSEEILEGNLKEITIILKEILVQIRKK